MLKVDKNNAIYLTRGDTAYLNFEIEGYEAREGDTITLTVRNYVDRTEAFNIVISLDEGFVITPAMTKDLDCGRYLYDIQITTVLGEVFTVIEPTPFYLREEVTL